MERRESEQRLQSFASMIEIRLRRRRPCVQACDLVHQFQTRVVQTRIHRVERSYKSAVPFWEFPG
jgi:hypothetical protein